MLPYTVLVLLVISIFAAFYSGFFVALFVIRKADNYPTPPIDIKPPSVSFTTEKKAKIIDEEDEKKNEFFN
jgi:hypothetical protein